MPNTLIAADATLPALAGRFPLAAALLSSWANEGSLLGDLSEYDVRRMDWNRGDFGIASITL